MALAILINLIKLRIFLLLLVQLLTFIGVVYRRFFNRRQDQAQLVSQNANCYVLIKDGQERGLILGDMHHFTRLEYKPFMDKFACYSERANRLFIDFNIYHEHLPESLKKSILTSIAPPYFSSFSLELYPGYAKSLDSKIKIKEMSSLQELSLIELGSNRVGYDLLPPLLSFQTVRNAPIIAGNFFSCRKIFVQPLCFFANLILGPSVTDFLTRQNRELIEKYRREYLQGKAILTTDENVTYYYHKERAALYATEFHSYVEQNPNNFFVSVLPVLLLGEGSGLVEELTQQGYEMRPEPVVFTQTQPADISSAEQKMCA